MRRLLPGGRRRPRTPAAERYARAGHPAGGLPWRDAAFAVVDLETTGLDPARDEIIQFGVVPVERGRIAAGHVVEGLVRPARMPEEQTVVIHGIRPVDLLHAPAQPAALGPLLDAMAGRVLVAHAAHVERAFLKPALAGCGARLRGPVVDTAELARLLWIERGRRDPGLASLPRLAAALNLPADRQHHALGDALTTAQCLLALATHLERELGPQRVHDLAAAGARVRTLRALGRG